MGYDRYDTRNEPRDEQRRWSSERDRDREWRSRPESGRHDPRGRDDDRGFWDRASDQVASWFGDDEAERRRRRDDHDNDRNFGRGRSANWNDTRGAFAGGGSSDRDYNRGWREEFSGRGSDRDRDRDVDRGWSDRYQPVTGDYGRSGGYEASGGPSRDDRDFGRSQSKWAQDEYRSTSRAGTANWSDRSRDDRSDRSREDRFDPHYQSWRERHMGELDRDYDDYRAENQSRFESEFGNWRERRQEKRGLLGNIREHMEVVGNDDIHVGKVDKVAGDRLILAKNDAESGGSHHSLSCSDIERVEGDRVILDCSADQARNRWRDENRSRALFERDDRGEMGPKMLDRSFQGTYR